MPTVTVVEHLAAPPAEVWALITDVTGYPALMASVLTIEILPPADFAVEPDAEADQLVVGWEIELEGAVMRWVELETRHPDRLRVDFHQLSGDLDAFDGFWQVTPRADGGSDVELSVHFEIGLELLREILDPYASDAIARNSSAMLRSLGRPG